MRFGSTPVGNVQNKVGQKQTNRELLKNRNPVTGFRASKIYDSSKTHKYLKYKAKYLHLKKLFE